MTTSTKDQRLNLRLSSQALAQIKQAAELSQQDLTSFLLGAALDRARTVIAEDQVLKLTPRDVAALNAALDAEPRVIPELAALFRRADQADH